MQPYPLLFEPLLKARVWGGRALSALGKRLPEGAAIGESWEIADLPESVEAGQSIIANGPLAGQTLRQAIQHHRHQIMGDGKLTAWSGFPLLIKYLDARENLSVQVHPDEAYAARHPGVHLKSEAWVVIDAEPGAVIYKGIKPQITASQFKHDLQSGDIVNDLVAVPAKPGDCHYLPSGTCHALGAGIVVAEIQTPSDTTFRVYDWGRSGRELHLQQALECIHFGPQFDARPSIRLIKSRSVETQVIAETDYFEIERLDAVGLAEFDVVTSSLPQVWMLIAGWGRLLNAEGATVNLHPGTTVLIPAALRDWRALLAAGTWLLRVKLPSPLKRMIA